MDTSIEYIKMCEMAIELHQLYEPLYPRQNKKNVGVPAWHIGDYYYETSETMKPRGVCISCGDDLDSRSNLGWWLPRLDQLAEMWENWNHRYSMAFFDEMHINSAYHPIQISNCSAYTKHLCCDSLEKHVLHRIMWGKYHKIWDTEKQVWYTTEERLTAEQKEENRKKDEDYEKFIKDHPPMDTI